MARRKDHTREELTSMAIDCGRALVREDGASALTARNLAARMGYTAGTLYNIFDNLEGIIIAINAATLEDMADEIFQIAREEAAPAKSIRRFCLAYLNYHEQEPELWKLLFATPVNRDALTEAYHAAAHKVFDPVTEALLPLSGSANNARQDAKILWSTLHGICLLQQNKKLDVSETDSAEALVDRFLENFLARPVQAQ